MIGALDRVVVHLNDGKAAGRGQHPYVCRRCRNALVQGDPMASYQLLDNPRGEWRSVCNPCGETILAHYRDTLHLTVAENVGDRWVFYVRA